MTVKATTEIPHEEIAVAAAAYKGKRTSRPRTALDKTTLRICGADYAISFVFRLMERFNVYGQTDLFNNTILIESNLTEPEALSTILHEILEIINRKHILGLDHDTLQKLEVMLFAVFADNPRFMEALARYAKTRRPK